jgi:hypothetical protein
MNFSFNGTILNYETNENKIAKLIVRMMMKDLKLR